MIFDLLQLIADLVNGWVMYSPFDGWSIQPHEDAFWFDCTIHGNRTCGPTD